MVSEFDKSGEPPGDNPDLEAIINSIFEELPDLQGNLFMGDGELPSPEPPPDPNYEDPEISAAYWHQKAENADPVDLPERGSIALGTKGWKEIESDADEPGITIGFNGLVVSNDQELVTAIDPNDFAIAIRDPEKSTISLLQISGDLVAQDDATLNQQFITDLDKSISTINDLAPENPSVQAVICGPSTFSEHDFQQFAQEHPGPTLEEVGMGVMDDLCEKAGQLQEFLASRFGETNVTTVLSGQFQQVTIRPDGKLEVDCFHSDDATEYDTRVFLPDSLTPLFSSSDDPEPFTKLDNNNVQYVINLTQVELNSGERLEWIASPHGEFYSLDNQDYFVSFDVNDSSVINPEVSVKFNTEGQVAGSAKGMVDGRTMRITELPGPDKVQTSDGAVDISLTLARQICNIGIHTGCDEVTIPASSLTSKSQSIQAKFRGLVGKSDVPKNQQIINDKAAQKLGFRRHDDGFWHLSLKP